LKIKKKPSGITKADKNAQKSDDLLKRNITSENPYEKIVGDITEVPCADGKLYVSALEDCFNSEISQATAHIRATTAINLSPHRNQVPTNSRNRRRRLQSTLYAICSSALRLWCNCHAHYLNARLLDGRFAM